MGVMKAIHGELTGATEGNEGMAKLVRIFEYIETQRFAEKNLVLWVALQDAERIIDDAQQTVADVEEVLVAYPNAQLEERFYGNRRQRQWIVFAEPWSILELGRGNTPAEAWTAAAVATFADPEAAQ
jgi:hypothetical protein